jgi:hypothetical protein
MPQMDDKVNIYFGRIDPAVWERIEDQPGAIVEQAIAALAKTIDAGQVVQIPPSRKFGIRKTLWLTPETIETLRRLSEQMGAYNTPIILAALELYLGPTLPSGEKPGADTER